MSHNIIFSTPEFVPSDDACLTSTQVAYNIEEAPPFEEIAPYLVEEGEDYIDADTVWNNLMPQAASVPDNRTRVYSTNTSPYNRIGLVVAWYDNNENGKWDAGEISKGSGSLQGPDVVLTAGHVIMRDGVWSHRVYYYPAKNGTGSDSTGEPYGQATSIACYVSSNWAVVGGNSDYDYGVVVINRNIGALTGYNGKAWTSGSLLGKDVTLTGYPGDKTGSLSETMWKMSGTIKLETTHKIYYDIYTVGCNSGSPVYDSSNIVWGVHTFGSSPYNGGVRITQNLYNLLQEKLEEGLERYK